MGLSIRAYARHRGVSHVAVKKAIDSGRISAGPDGTIDAQVADAQWAANTQPVNRSAAQPPMARAAAPAKPQSAARELPETPAPALSAGGTSLLQARTVNEVLKAKLKQYELAQKKDELVDRSKAIAHVFTLARAERDAWLNWPARVSAQMASGLGVEQNALHIALETAVLAHLQELGELRASVD